jgi:hypothetical protein
MQILAPKLTSYQKAILESPKRFTITEAATKCGKTFSHNWWLFREAHKPEQPKEGANYWWVAPVYSQAEIAFNRIVQKIHGNPQYQINRSNLKIKTPRGTYLHFKSADNPDNLYGEDVYAAVFDEFTRAKAEAWHALRSTLTFTGGKCKLIGNHTGLGNWGHMMKEKCKDANSEYEYFKITAYDAANEGIIKHEEIEQARKDLPHDVFMQLYMAESVTDKRQLISNDKILDLFTNSHLKFTGDKFITCDIAITNDDFVVFVWDGFVVIDYFCAKGGDEEKVKAKIFELKDKHQVPNSNIAYDADGMGMAFRSAFSGMVTIHNGSNLGKQYKNAKTHFEFEIAEMINKGLIYISCPMAENVKSDIIEELQQLKVADSSLDGKLSTISKDEIKKNIGRSPDKLDALKYRMIWAILWKK